MNNGDIDEAKVMNKKEQELDCLKKVSNVNGENIDKSKVFLHIGIRYIDIVKEGIESTKQSTPLLNEFEVAI